MSEDTAPAEKGCNNYSYPLEVVTIVKVVKKFADKKLIQAYLEIVQQKCYHNGSRHLSKT